MKLSRVAGWLGVVGKSDFNENPVVSLDLDFDLGFVKTAIRFENFSGGDGWLEKHILMKSPFISLDLDFDLGFVNGKQ